MTTSFQQHRKSAHEVLFRSAAITADLWRREALDELGRMFGQTAAASTGEAEEMTIASLQRGDHYTVVAISGSVDVRAVRRLGAHLHGLLDAGTHHLVVDLSWARHIDHHLLDLMRFVESWTSARNGSFELTGLAPAVLHEMADDPLAEVFALYRAGLEQDVPRSASWADLRCPQGLSEVPEPRTSARHRSILDVGAR